MSESRNDILGWATDDLIALDALAPGLIRRVVMASPVVREAIHLVLARREMMRSEPERPFEIEGDDQILACLLRSGRAREILAHSFGRIPPDGLLGALERVDGPMRSAQSYIELQCFFENPASRRKADVLKYVGKITERMVAVADVLDHTCIHSQTLKRIESVREAAEFNRAVAFAMALNSHVTDEVVQDGIAKLPEEVPLARMVSRWVRRADRFPTQPVIESNQLRPLATSRDLIGAGYRFRNCLGTKGLEQALIGEGAFLEFQSDGHEGAILELRPLSDQRGWVLWEVHVYRNGLAPNALEEAARSACSAVGIPHLGGRSKDEDWRQYRKFTRMGRGPFG